MDKFNSESRNYSLDDEFLNGLLEAQKDSNEAFYVLRLLYPDVNYQDPNLHQDHLHPQTIFIDENKLHSSIPQKDWEFAQDPKNWNSVSNLQLLVWQINESKNDTPLAEWVGKNNIQRKSIYLSENVSLDIKDFKAFISDRRKNIIKYLKDMIL